MWIYLQPPALRWYLNDMWINCPRNISIGIVLYVSPQFKLPVIWNQMGISETLALKEHPLKVTKYFAQPPTTPPLPGGELSRHHPSYANINKWVKQKEQMDADGPENLMLAISFI